MKNLFFISIITAFSLFSCVDFGSDDITFTMFNQTDKTVKIVAFDTKNESTGIIYSEPVKANDIDIAPHSSFKVTRITGLDSNITQSFYSQKGIDSVRVIFNNERVKVYTRESTRNTLDSSILDGDKDENHFITEEDYESAEDCNGDCE